MRKNLTVTALMTKKRELDDELTLLIDRFERETGAVLGAVYVENSTVVTRFDYVGVTVNGERRS